jgi:hypothetical protein
MSGQHATYDDARKRSLIAASTIRILGVPLHGRDAGAAVTIWWCGIGVDGAEHREPTHRIWHIPRADIADSGEVEGFCFEGHDVHWYDVKPDCAPVEESYAPVSLTHSARFYLRGRFGGGGWGGGWWGVIDGGDEPIPVTISPSPTVSPTGAPPTTIQP